LPGDPARRGRPARAPGPADGGRGVGRGHRLDPDQAHQRLHHGDLTMGTDQGTRPEAADLEAPQRIEPSYPKNRATLGGPRLGPVGWARWAWRQLTSMRTALALLLLL